MPFFSKCPADKFEEGGGGGGGKANFMGGGARFNPLDENFVGYTYKRKRKPKMPLTASLFEQLNVGGKK